MSLWSRFKRVLRSIFGGALSSMEDPRLILEQNIRDLNDQVPKMNQNIATVKANVILLEKEALHLKSRIAQTTSRVKAAIQVGRDDLAQQHAMHLESARTQQQKTAEQLQGARMAYDKAQEVKKAFMRERQRKIDDAQTALRAHERAKWQAEVADAMEQFEVGGIDQTHDDMIQQIEKETAHNEARMELALDSIDTQALRLDEDVEQIRASELVNQFKLEMGMAEKPKTTDDIDMSEFDMDTEQEDKTIGRNRTSI